MIKKEIIWNDPSEKLPEVFVKNGREYYEGVLLLYKYESCEKPLRYVVATYISQIKDKKDVWLEHFTGKDTYLDKPDYWSYLKDSYPEDIRNDK